MEMEIDDETLALITTICSLLNGKNATPRIVAQKYRQVCYQIQRYRQALAQRRPPQHDD